MISLFSKYAKVITLTLALLIAAPVAISAAETSVSNSPESLGQNTNRAFNGGGAPVRRRVRRKARRKARRHRHNHAVLVHLTR